MSSNSSFKRYDVTVAAMSSTAWRNSEGTIISLGGETLLLAYDQFYGPPYRWDIDDDFWSSRVMGKLSHDLGRTWDESFLIQPNDAQINYLSPCLLKLRSGDIALFYRKTESVNPTTLMGYMRRSSDGGRTWSPEQRLADSMSGGIDEYRAGRWFGPDANDSVLQLNSGRILVPAGRTQRGAVDHTGIEWHTKLSSFCFLSDDHGRTWHRSTGEFSAPGRGSMEPHFAELSDGRIVGIMRTDQGHVYRTYSRDGGETWSPSEPITELRAPESCPQLGRIPGTDTLVLLYNDSYTPGADHGGCRNPLSVALSDDGGATWGRKKDLVVRDRGEWQDQKGQRHVWSWVLSNPSLTFVNGMMIVTYYEGVTRVTCHGVPCSLGLTAVDVRWLTESSDP